MPACARLAPLPRRRKHSTSLALQGSSCGSGCTCAPPRFLLKKGYEVHGIIRRSSSFNTGRIEELYQDPHVDTRKLILHYGDLTDSTNCFEIVSTVRPDELYNLGAQSHVKVSFEMSEYTADADGMGVLRLLNAIRSAGLVEKTKFYQASTSELYGLVQEVPQKRDDPLLPALALRGRQAVRLLDRGQLPRGVRHARVERHPLQPRVAAPRPDLCHAQGDARRRAHPQGDAGVLYMGNMDAKRDWGHARDYVEMMWMMLQQDSSDDFVVATGETNTVRSFIETRLLLHRRRDRVEGRGRRRGGHRQEVRHRSASGSTPSTFRPTEVELLIGDPTKAKEKLGWVPQVKMAALCREMVLADIALVEKGDMTS